MISFVMLHAHAYCLEFMALHDTRILQEDYE